MALPKKNRLISKKDIDRVFKKGGTVKGSSLFIRFLSNQEKSSKIAFVIPVKYVPLAADRNRIRRILSGTITRTPSLLKQGQDIVVVISRKINRKEFGNLIKELNYIFSKVWKE